MAKKTIQRTFTPSYDAADRALYEDAVRDGGKRLRHVQIRGGHESFLSDARLASMSEEAAARLARQAPPWDRRTQSPRTPHHTERGVELTQRIREGLTRYRESTPQRTLGLLVPNSPYPLMEARVPTRAATILVRRAAGRLFPVATLASLTRTDVPLREAFIGHARAAPVALEGPDGLGIEVQGTRFGPLQTVTFELDGRSIPIITRADLAASRAAWKEAIRARGGRFRADFEDDTWVARIFETAEMRMRQRAAAKKMSGEAVFRFKSGEVRVPYPATRSTSGASTPLQVKYRTLENVSLDELPALLSRLSRRKARTLRPPLALENPVGTDNDFWMEQYWQGAFEPSRVPAARRNMAGRASLHGLPRAKGKRGTKEQQKLGAAALEAIVASGGRGAASAKRELAWRGKDRAGRRDIAQPATRKTKKSRAKHAAATKAARREARPNGRHQARMAMELYHSGRAPSLKAAWRMVKSGARQNPRYQPDLTHIREALVPYDTGIAYANGLALENGLALQNRRRKGRKGKARRNTSGLERPGALWLDYWDPNFEDAKGQFGVSEAWTSGIQPMTRRNSKKNPRRDAKGRFVKAKAKSSKRRR